MQNTIELLTVFFSGQDSPCSKINDIEFINGRLPSKILSDVILHNINEICKVIFITDSSNGGTVFDIRPLCSFFCRKSSKVVSLYVDKNFKKTKKCKRSHGIFTNYFCKLICDFPEISPKCLTEKINPSILPFSEFFKFEVSSNELANAPILSK